MKMVLLLVMGLSVCGMSQGAILHDIPEGDCTILPDLVNTPVNDSMGNPAGWWASHRSFDETGTVAAVGTGSDRHLELSAGWYPRQVAAWYIDYQQTPADSAWKISADMKWAGGTATNLSLGLFQDEGGSIRSFGLVWTGTAVSWVAGSASGSFTSATGLDNTYRTASIAYDPVTGNAVGRLGSETIFQTTAGTGLTVKRVDLHLSTNDVYDNGVLSVDNITAQVPEPASIGFILIGGIMAMKRRCLE